MIEVIPSILEKDFKEIEIKIRMVEGAVVWAQIDIADGKLVSNTTFSDPSAFKSLKTKTKLEAHLMVEDPVKYVKPFIKAGFKRLYAHVESGQATEFIEEVNKYDCLCGLAIDGPTPYEKIAEYLDNIDNVLVMTIDAGFSGKPFREDTLPKIRKIHETFFELPIATDGAMNNINAQKAVTAGATIICSNSYLFSAIDPKKQIEILKNLR